jgi:hypothetical protein
VNALVGSADERVPEGQVIRAGKIAVHFMNQVWDFHGPMSANEFNKKVFDLSIGTFLKGFRQEVSAPAPAQAPAQVQVQRKAVQPQQRARPEALSVEDRYQQLQQDRTAPKQKPPQIPDFKISLENDKNGPSPAELYTQETKRREDEAARIQALLEASQGKKPAMGGTPIQKVNTIGVGFVEDGEEDEERVPRPSPGPNPSPKIEVVDPRKKTKVEEEELDSMMNMENIYRSMVSASGAAGPSLTRDPNANYTTAKPDIISTRSIQQQDILIRDESVVSYKEHEDNLFLYSADRDWVNDITQTRYNFTINFDTANNKHGFNKNLSVVQRFKNISRIEMVKTILPIEGVETMFNVDLSGASAVAPYTYKRISAYQFPYIALRIPELDVNNYGSDDQLNNSFAILQYDSEWYSDTFYPGGGETTTGNSSGNSGFTTFIPKHLKCQKVYQPTPLATLSKLSIEMNRPDGSQLSYLPDTVDISSVVLCETGGANSSLYFTSKAVDSATNSYYIILRTKTYFSRWSFAVGDRIQVGGITPDQIGGAASGEAKYELLDFLQDNAGHIIAGIGFDKAGIVDGYNSFGYANWIAIRAPINDPTTGDTSVRTIGGSQGAYAALQTSLAASSIVKGRILNQSHQVQLVFRIVTREKDSTSRVRPDNL